MCSSAGDAGDAGDAGAQMVAWKVVVEEVCEYGLMAVCMAVCMAVSM